MQVGHTQSYSSMNSLLAMSFADRDISAAAEAARLARSREAQLSNFEQAEALSRSQTAAAGVQNRRDVRDILQDTQLQENQPQAQPQTIAQPKSLGDFLRPRMLLSPTAEAEIFGSAEFHADPLNNEQAHRRAGLTQSDITDILGGRKNTVPEVTVELEVEEKISYDYDIGPNGELIESVERQRVVYDPKEAQATNFDPINTAPDSIASRATSLYTQTYYNTAGDAPRYDFTS